jgi:hypothetical protein
MSAHVRSLASSTAATHACANEEACYIAQNIARNCGWAVFPCRGEDKAPARPKWEGGSGYQDATTDPEQISWLWEYWPGSLIGIATGAVSGIDVLDIDVKHETAPAWWKAASRRIQATRTYRTRSGGLHVYFQHAEGVGNTASKLAKGVDTRGDGGYVIYWFGAGFESVDQSPSTPWPAWLLECVLWERPPPPPVPRRGPDHADKAIEGIVRTVSGATEGSRNSILYWGAQRLKERVNEGQISRNNAEAQLIAAAQSVGLSQIEASRTIGSAWRAA